MKRLLLFLFLFPTFLSAQGLPIKSGATSDLASVTTKNAIEQTLGKSARATYAASSSALVTTAAYNLSIESSAGTGFRVLNFCVGYSVATAAAGITISVNRRSTASSGGTTLTAEGTGADSISKMDPSDSNYGGVARRTATLGTIGATLFQAGLTVPELGAGAADPGSGGPFCYDFTAGGAKAPVVASGTANGVSITVTAPGAGGLAFGSINATIVAEN